MNKWINKTICSELYILFLPSKKVNIASSYNNWYKKVDINLNRLPLRLEIYIL